MSVSVVTDFQVAGPLTYAETLLLPHHILVSAFNQSGFARKRTKLGVNPCCVCTAQLRPRHCTSRQDRPRSYEACKAPLLDAQRFPILSAVKCLDARSPPIRSCLSGNSVLAHNPTHISQHMQRVRRQAGKVGSTVPYTGYLFQGGIGAHTHAHLTAVTRGCTFS